MDSLLKMIDAHDGRHITSQLRQARSSTMENLAKAKSFAESVSSGCSKDVN